MGLALRYEDNWETERYALLKTRICDLKFHFAESPVFRCIQKLYSELARKGVSFRPEYYFTCSGDEWGCPDRVPVIGIPFHLADNRLSRIEREMGYKSYDRKDLMILLRHETGHAINYAYELFSTVEWKSIFGDFEKTYPHNFQFKFNPYSRDFVKSQGEPKYYAQAHPDEDFAETFAVWLTPRSKWKTEYQGWPAIRKLEYVERTMNRIRAKRPIVREGALHSPYTEKTYRLIEYYGEDIDRFKDNALGLYDLDLLRIFAPSSNGRKSAVPVHALIKRNRSFLIRTIAEWTGAREKVVQPVIHKFLQRSRKLALTYLPDDEMLRLSALTALGTAIVMNYLHTGRYIAD